MKSMINDDYVVPKEDKKEYPLLPKNIYQVECLDIQLKDATGQYAQAGDKNFAFQFTLLAGSDKGESLRGRNVWDNFVKTSLFIGKKGKSNIWQIIEAFIGRELTQEEVVQGVKGSMINSFIGKQIRIFIDHKTSEKDGKIYNIITSYMPTEVTAPSLTEKERDDATVKVKVENVVATPQNTSGDDVAPMPTDDIDISRIPF
jgi:hypothetical protein